MDIHTVMPAQSTPASWFRCDGIEIILSVHVMPGAKRTAIQGLHGDALKIRVAAPPVDGAANAELQKFLAQQFDVPQRSVALIAGATSRSKRFSIQDSAIAPRSLLKQVGEA